MLLEFEVTPGKMNSFNRDCTEFIILQIIYCGNIYYSVVTDTFFNG